MKLKYSIRRFLFLFQYELGTKTKLFITLYKLLGKNQPLLVGKDTDIVIEGYPRSGNTFSVVAFELAQSRKLKIAHHLHAAAQIIWALKHGVPAVVLIREPVDAVVSLVIREPHLSIGLALREYVKFYRALYPYKDQFLIARFDEVVTDYGRVIARINEKFGTDYDLFDHNDSNVEKVFKLVQEYAIGESSNNVLDERKVARPSTNRKADAGKLTCEIQNSEYDELLMRAEWLYSHLALRVDAK